MATFADDTAILSSDPDPVRATEKLQHHLNLLQHWLEQWRIKVNPTKSAQVTFTTRRDTCPPVNLHNTPIPVKKEVKYLRLHLDKKLTWKTHIKAKRYQLELKLKHKLANKRTFTAIPRQQTNRTQGNRRNKEVLKSHPTIIERGIKIVSQMK